MGHDFHGYISHNQRVCYMKSGVTAGSVWQIKCRSWDPHALLCRLSATNCWEPFHLFSEYPPAAPSMATGNPWKSQMLGRVSMIVMMCIKILPCSLRFPEIKLVPAFWPRLYQQEEYVPSGKHTKSYRKSPFLIGKPSINGPFSIGSRNCSVWWYTYPSEKYASLSVGMMKFPAEWKVIK